MAQDDDKEIAEDYRRQRQAALAEKIGIGAKTRNEQLQWIEDNKEQVLTIVRATAGPIRDEAAILEEYKQALITTSRGSAFDDINARQILERVIGDVEHRPVQSRIARIRTDLDSFSDTEAYTLMLSGYRMMSREAVESLSHLPLQQENREEDWTFRRGVEAVALRVQGKEVEHVDLLKQLGIGANQLFKVWRSQRWWPQDWAGFICSGICSAQFAR
jgi:hypothetical protein